MLPHIILENGENIYFLNDRPFCVYRKKYKYIYINIKNIKVAIAVRTHVLQFAYIYFIFGQKSSTKIEKSKSIFLEAIF
jgi:hypothetical protein